MNIVKVIRRGSLMRYKLILAGIDIQIVRRPASIAPDAYSKPITEYLSKKPEGTVVRNMILLIEH